MCQRDSRQQSTKRSMCVAMGCNIVFTTSTSAVFSLRGYFVTCML